MSENHGEPIPASLIAEHLHLFTEKSLEGPVLDLACGNGHNGIFLATKGLEVTLSDNSEEALKEAAKLAQENQVKVTFWQVDLEKEGRNPLPAESFGAILVFRYLHRPLIPCIRKSLRNGGILLYETYTVEQPKFGKPHNPHFLLKPGELQKWFGDWEILYKFEGIEENPKRAIAQVVCRKPGQD
jgi:SAM-dependent methyltransferase